MLQAFLTQLVKILHKARVNRSRVMGDTVINRSNPIVESRLRSKNTRVLVADINLVFFSIYIVKLKHVSSSPHTTNEPTES
ncbi:hypothetical protein DEO72_LG6g2987 [Vigna unguiculata]|uniref:Uncharacterized protein n=1 Tax=Vigna unguiculata TaxID=3917 RepID=A0A4D6MA52_VIGUN|nr:hypothetical protein DEO72_LG6g2987 [Vigna unguiculata]